MKKLVNVIMVDEFLTFGVILSILVRWLVSLFPYSGAGKPPMFGDFEAQRHWMEITYHLPPSEWYYNTTDNDLSYWGLDYPPLTAYHSWMNGLISDKIDSSWVKLHSSRGHESYENKLFMRSSVLISDLLIYIPAVLKFWKYSQPSLPSRSKAIAVTTMLLYPGLYLIDYGHFQYNCCSLGLTLWAIVALCTDRQLVATVLFTLALNYKQMELYHALPFFFYLLGRAWHDKENCIWKIVKLGLTVVITFVIIWFPFITHVPQVLIRIFPVSRGIFEDKVSNFWCSLNLFWKFRNSISNQSLSLISGISTLLTVLPSSIQLFRSSTIRAFKLSLVNVSLAFFLFSYHVHEKSILLVAIPVCLILNEYPISSVWFLLISMFSMFPLLVKDGLTIPFFTLFIMYSVGCYVAYFHNYFNYKMNFEYKIFNWILPVMITSSIIGTMVLSIAHLLLEPPSRYPDLFPVLISFYSFVHFFMFFVLYNFIQFRDGRIFTIYTKLKRL